MTQVTSDRTTSTSSPPTFDLDASLLYGELKWIQDQISLARNGTTPERMGTILSRIRRLVQQLEKHT